MSVGAERLFGEIFCRANGFGKMYANRIRCPECVLLLGPRNCLDDCQSTRANNDGDENLDLYYSARVRFRDSCTFYSSKYFVIVLQTKLPHEHSWYLLKGADDDLLRTVDLIRFLASYSEIAWLFSRLNAYTNVDIILKWEFPLSANNTNPKLMTSGTSRIDRRIFGYLH